MIGAAQTGSTNPTCTSQPANGAGETSPVKRIDLSLDIPAAEERNTVSSTFTPFTLWGRLGHPRPPEVPQG